MKLKSCPHCGKEAARFTDCTESVCSGHSCEYIATCRCMTFAIVCDRHHGGCGATGGYYRTKEEAIEAWNRRVNDDRP